MFDRLSQTFSSLFARLGKESSLTEKNIQESLDQIRQALLDSDVPYNVVETFVSSVKQEVVGQKVIGSLKPAEQLMKTVNDKMTAFLGGKNTGVFSFQLPSVVMVMGLQGSGKTTSIAKMAHFVQKEALKRKKKRKILVASVDFYRPAAVEQLEVLSQKIDVSFYRAQATDPVQAAQEIYDYYCQEGFELLFLDTAGRLHVDEQMIQELKDIDALVKPKYKLLVLDAMTGQESLNVAQAFDKAIGFQAAVLTKMDSDTRGGAAFAFRYAIKKSIIFTGVGEKPDDLQRFHADRITGRMLGMGDMQTLIEKADEKIKKSEQDQAYQSFSKGKLTLADFAQQMEMMNRLGSLSQIMRHIPGMGKAQVSQEVIDRGELEMKRFRAIISSMTQKERLNHVILNGLRKKRIAQGAGVSVSDVNLLLSRFEQAQQYVKLMKKSGPLRRLFR